MPTDGGGSAFSSCKIQTIFFINIAAIMDGYIAVSLLVGYGILYVFSEVLT